MWRDVILYNILVLVCQANTFRRVLVLVPISI